jgi:hypothetical protein
MPDIFSVLLIIGILFLLAGSIFVTYDLMVTYGLSFGELFSGVKLQ